MGEEGFSHDDDHTFMTPKAVLAYSRARPNKHACVARSYWEQPTSMPTQRKRGKAACVQEPHHEITWCLQAEQLEEGRGWSGGNSSSRSPVKTGCNRDDVLCWSPLSPTTMTTTTGARLLQGARFQPRGLNIRRDPKKRHLIPHAQARALTVTGKHNSCPHHASGSRLLGLFVRGGSARSLLAVRSEAVPSSPSDSTQSYHPLNAPTLLPP